MRHRWKPVTAAFVTAAVVTLAGVVLFFQPVAESDAVSGAPVPQPVGFLVYVGLCVALFDWLAFQMRSAWKAAFALAAGQYVVVIDLALRGERGLLTLAASGALLAVTWLCVGFVYARLHPGGGRRPLQAEG